MDRLIIIGASGHGKVVSEIAVLNGYKNIAFLDDDFEVKECGGFPVIGNTLSAPDGDYFIAIGNSQCRKELMNKYADKFFPVLIHPNAVLSKDVEIGEGTVVMAGTVINSGTRIGKGCIVNTSSSIDHDCSIGVFCHISVGAHLCGTVKVGNMVWIGAGATISNNVNICGECMFGAGTVVIKDIIEPGTYVGVPARKMNAGKKNE